MQWNTDDVIRVALASFCENQLAINILHYRVSAIVTGVVDLQDVADAFSGGLGPSLADCMNISADFRGVMCNRIHPAPLSVQAISTVGQQAGTVAGDAMSKQTSGIITWQTSLAGRSNRGRTYVPFPGEADNDAAGHPTAGYVARLNLFGADVMLTTVVTNGANSVTFIPIVLRRNSVATSQAILAKRANVKWATQRRRGDYGRANTLPF